MTKALCMCLLLEPLGCRKHHYSTYFSSFLKPHSNRQSMMQQLKPFIPIPKYFQSEWSYAHYRIPTQTSHISLSASSQHRSATDDVPDEERCTVGWIPAPPSNTQASGDDYHLVALTYTGGWYRLSTPRASQLQDGGKPSSSTRQRSDSTSTVGSRTDKGKEKEDKGGKQSRRCTLEEFRRFGRWDGWG